MQLNTDFLQRVCLLHHDLPWVDSPMPGVRRRMLERDGDEVARATSIVQYAPGSRFPRHNHALGEEILVLEGVLTDEFGRHGAGTYLKNPAGTAHSPATEHGCTLLVKLRHLDPSDRQQVRVDATTAQWHPGLVEGLTVLPLSSFGTSHTAMVRWAPGTTFHAHRHHGGEEIFVVDGTFEDEHGSYPAGSWIRSPHRSLHTPFSRSGCTIFVKTGHLA
ncbi:MAG: cupin domain-containing protein [Methylibium sp.]